ncbi:hypothetical protein BDW71DRAFT_187562 [Aspergillus fruticulosus]
MVTQGLFFFHLRLYQTPSRSATCGCLNWGRNRILDFQLHEANLHLCTTLKRTSMRGNTTSRNSDSMHLIISACLHGIGTKLTAPFLVLVFIFVPSIYFMPGNMALCEGNNNRFECYLQYRASFVSQILSRC